MRRVNRLIRFFHQSWTEKRQANLQLSTKDGDISIKLDLQLGRPEDIMPGPVAAGHPAGTPQRRRPRRRRGPAAKERSRQRAAAYHASRAGAQAPFPPPPPPAPQVSSTRLVKVVKKSVGSQHSFFNLDGARASIDSADRLSISERPEEEEADEANEEEGSVPSPAASPESHLPDVLIWVEGQPMLVPGTCDIATEYPDASREGPWGEHWEQEERRKKEEEKEEKEEESDTTDHTDPIPTLGSTRNSSDPEVTTESTDDRCLRPLQRARDRRAARLQQESEARAVTNFDPHDSPSGRSSASSNLEQDRPQLQCCGCNKTLSESDLSSVEDLNLSLKRAGPSGLALLAESEVVPACAACRNHWSL